MPETRLIELADGRELAWVEYGDPHGMPVMAFHGSPGTRNFFEPVADVAEQKGVRLISPDRPGYGHSTYHPGRTFESWARDVGQLGEHLGADRFAVIGASSGGPNAASCARFLADRVVGSALVSSPAPPEVGPYPGAMSVANRVVQQLSMVAPRLMGSVFEAGLRWAQRRPDRALIAAGRSMPTCDAAVMERPEIRSAMRNELARPVSPTAGRAAVQDLRLELRPWGFRLRDIEGSVDVWHGEMDPHIPVASARYQADEIPRATLQERPDDGHFIVYRRFEEILDKLLV